MASLVDCLVEAKRTIIQLPEPAHEYHSLSILADELSAFMPLYEPELIGGLTTFYDCVPYAQHRRGKDIRVKIESPQLNILSGSTPSNLLKFVPEIAWEQGFMSRVIMVYSDQRPLVNIFAKQSPDLPQDMLHDLKQIATLHGEFKWTTDYEKAILDWRAAGQPHVPAHPKLAHYNSRRLGHVLKLSMVSSIDRGNTLRLEASDFGRALHWLMDAEEHMPTIFQTGQLGPDAQAMDEIVAFINGHDLIEEHKIVRHARKLTAAHNVMKLIDVMERGQIIQCVKTDRFGVRLFRVVRENQEGKS